MTGASRDIIFHLVGCTCTTQPLVLTTSSTNLRSMNTLYLYLPPNKLLPCPSACLPCTRLRTPRTESTSHYLRLAGRGGSPRVCRAQCGETRFAFYGPEYTLAVGVLHTLSYTVWYTVLASAYPYTLQQY